MIEWNADPAIFIAKAISPHASRRVLNEPAPPAQDCHVIVPEDQLSLAIGRDGQNARLAAKLTGWRIDSRSVFRSRSETLQLVRSLFALLEQIGEELLQTIRTCWCASRKDATFSRRYTNCQVHRPVERRLVAARTPEKQAEPEKPSFWRAFCFGIRNQHPRQRSAGACCLYPAGSGYNTLQSWQQKCVPSRTTSCA